MEFTEKMNNIDDSDKIEVITNLCQLLADILKDPTHGGKKELSADGRQAARESAHDELLTTIDVLAASAHFNQGFFDVLNIVSKYKENK